ncbi:uncharacterized protein LOC100677825 [Nasonia vitripennis]|uniref:Uncharacterized protein n=1 Tax=Nasonia vitripennis TaxID=7425 RepID=A0A7M7HBH5_NASVI|nr:uncharacterized protein LOC100677825 [Nasonia vitripennis]XP_016845937.1 uncharacterized protein LOC100677825 [Nasonia vitripennis]XP_031777195.1 uncharacterized protein LOC100677825 [Nasonia vitripennis]
MGKTRGVHETTPEIRNRMVGMYEAGLGLSEIAAAVNCSQRTVKRWLNRFDKEGTVETRDRCGRKRATTQEQDEAIIRLATQTSITAAKAVLPALGLNCSVDTIRERLHRAGIHNWSPSKKHIQKISVAVSEGSGIEQAVWRPTGTQVGKNKKKVAKDKKSRSQTKKKRSPQKAKPKAAVDDDANVNNTTAILPPQVHQPSFSFSLPAQNVPMQPMINEMQSLPVPPSMGTSHPSETPNANHYTHPLNIPHSQSMYHQQQSWPLDLVQAPHLYPQSQEVPNQHQDQLTQQLQTQMQPSIHLEQPVVHEQNLNTCQTEQHRQMSELSRETLHDSQDAIINVCSDVCSNSNSSFNDNSQSSTNDDESKSEKKRKLGKSRKKKGGKVKGTLETSVEIRNRMIGMSEAGLSTLSIALAINRSERTVKRWLDRWHKEGNVQTKERKGRKRITTKEQDDAIIAMATQQPLTAAKHVAPALGLKCSVDTIRERLHKAGIHSWKLGKKQGEGNAVHTVHLWQPSGNRSSKVKSNGGKKKKSQTKKQNQNSGHKKRQGESKSQKDETLPRETTEPPVHNVIPQSENIPFQQAHPQPLPTMQTTHDIMSDGSAPVPHLSQHSQVSSMCSQLSSSLQTLQPLGPMVPPRPDCRLALPTIIPSIASQTSTNVTYPSCMMSNNSHTSQMEQPVDTINYEPYIWSF